MDGGKLDSDDALRVVAEAYPFISADVSKGKAAAQKILGPQADVWSDHYLDGAEMKTAVAQVACRTCMHACMHGCTCTLPQRC